MNNLRLLLPALGLLALAQLYVPARMIWDQEEILDSGVEFKFETAALDPSDLFRGKYITLNFGENTVSVPDERDWTIGEQVYVSFTTDERGFANIVSVAKEEPTDHPDFLKVDVGFVSGNGSHQLIIDYPFDRFYMEESKAYDAEQMYRQSMTDSTTTTYALVSIKDGRAALKDVLIDGVPIRELVEADREKNTVK